MHDIMTDEMRGDEDDPDRMEWNMLYDIEDKIIDEKEKLGMVNYYKELLKPIGPDSEGLPQLTKWR